MLITFIVYLTVSAFVAQSVDNTNNNNNKNNNNNNNNNNKFYLHNAFNIFFINYYTGVRNNILI